jgi:hypothetical protein
VTLSDADATAVVHYTVDGTAPSAASPTAQPINVASSQTINAIAVPPNGAASTAASFAYVISPPPPPTASPAPGTFASAQSVTLSDADATAVVHYTVDGTAPTAASATVQPINVASSQTINAIAVRASGSTSTVASFAYVITPPPPPPPGAPVPPTASPAPGTYASAQSVTLSDADATAVVHYTVDGTAPTAASPTAQPVNVATSETIKAIAVAANGSASSVASFAYVISPPPPAQTVAPAPLTAAGAQANGRVLPVMSNAPLSAATGTGGTPTAPLSAASVTAGTLGAVSVSRRYRVRDVRSHGVRFTAALPAGAHSLHVRILQRVRHGKRRAGTRVLYTHDYPTPSTAGPLAVAVRPGRLALGSYVLEVALGGDSRASLHAFDVAR